MPQVTLSWIWTEQELNCDLLKKYQTRSLPFELPNASKTEYIANHIYFDLSREDTVSIETIDSKILVCPTFATFKDMILTNWKKGDFAKILYGKWAFDLRYGRSPFLMLDEALKWKPKQPKSNALTVENLRSHNDEYGHRQNTNNWQQIHHHRSKMKQRIKRKKQHKMNYDDDDEDMDIEIKKLKEIDSQYKDIRIPKRKNNFFRMKSEPQNGKKRKRMNVNEINESNPNKKRKKMVDDSSSIASDSSNYGDEDEDCSQVKMVKKAKRAKTARKKILEKNKTNISDEAMNEMKKICKRLNIGKQPNIGCKLYFFGTHLDAYKCIDKLFKSNDDDSFRAFIFKQKQSYCRDMKSALYTKGSIVPLATMKENISKRFNELKPCYKN